MEGYKINEVIQNILSRRSIRSYKKEQILDPDLDIILKAAQYAPSGGNSQSWRFTVVQNQPKLEQLNALVRKAFQNMVVDDTTYKSKKSSKIASKNDNYSFYYHAPTLVIVSNEREYSNSITDCSVALENIFLAANSLGLGSCWINQLAWLCDEPNIREVLTELSIPENHIVCGAATLGYISGNKPPAALRREGTANIIR